MYFVLFFVNGRIIHTDHFDNSPDAFGRAEDHANHGDNGGSDTYDAVVFEVVDGLPVHIRSY